MKVIISIFISTAHVLVRPILKTKYKKDQRIGNHSVEFQKGRRTYFGVRVGGAGGILQGKASNALLYIPKSLQAFVYGHIHTNHGPFLQEIPEDHCLVAPIVEYHYEATKHLSNKNVIFKIKVPHCVTRKEDLKFIQVQHGNIHNGVAFTQLPTFNSYFKVGENYITIYTRQFSQFICTSCQDVCHGQARAFMFGKVTPRTTLDPTTSLRLYMCSPLHNIRDYKKVSGMI